jgi:hypothetical protein
MLKRKGLREKIFAVKKRISQIAPAVPKPKSRGERLALVLRNYQIKFPRKGKEREPGKIDLRKEMDFMEDFLATAFDNREIAKALTHRTQTKNVEEQISEIALAHGKGDRKKATELLDSCLDKLIKGNKELVTVMKTKPYFRKVAEREGVSLNDFVNNSVHAHNSILMPVVEHLEMAKERL